MIQNAEQKVLKRKNEREQPEKYPGSIHFNEKTGNCPPKEYQKHSREKECCGFEFVFLEEEPSCFF